MNIKSPLKKIFMVLLWCLLGGTGLATTGRSHQCKKQQPVSGVWK